MLFTEIHFPKLRTRDALACLEPDEGRGQEILGSGPQASPSASENFEFERDVNRLNTGQRRQFRDCDFRIMTQFDFLFAKIMDGESCLNRMISAAPVSVKIMISHVIRDFFVNFMVFQGFHCLA
jgi:hypothetical protein